jgi:hypothetical protein
MVIVTATGLTLAIFAGVITTKDRNVFEYTTLLRQKVIEQELEVLRAAEYHQRTFKVAVSIEDCEKKGPLDGWQQLSEQNYCSSNIELQRLKANRNRADELQIEYLMKQDEASSTTANYLVSTGFLRLGIVLTMLLVLHMLFKIYLNANQSLVSYRAIASSLLLNKSSPEVSLEELKKFNEIKMPDESKKPIEHLTEIITKIAESVKTK